jgi:protein-S-isoprenylcysteine O-methyltransferase Ste14
VKLFLAVRSLLFVVLIPGTVVGYIPTMILRNSGQPLIPAWSVHSLPALGVFLAGVSVLLRCVWDFFSAGRGTLAPFDPPRLLVVRGLYRYTRNPMYNGVLAALLGEAWLYHSVALFEYAAMMFVLFHVVVLIYEEPILEAQFGGSYRTYRRAVPRWGFTIRPYSTSRAGSP